MAARGIVTRDRFARRGIAGGKRIVRENAGASERGGDLGRVIEPGVGRIGLGEVEDLRALAPPGFQQHGEAVGLKVPVEARREHG